MAVQSGMKKGSEGKLRASLLYSLLVVFLAQISVNVFVSSFEISIGIMLIPILLLVVDDFPLFRVTLFSGIGVFVSRVMVAYVQYAHSAITVSAYLPEMLFYFVYGLLLGALIGRRIERFCPGKRHRLILLLVLIDYCANFVELCLRLGGSAFSWRVQLGILLVACIRSLVIYLLLLGIDHYGYSLVSRENLARFQTLSLLISKLQGEVIWMDKNTSRIEETMSSSYQLYNDLKDAGGDAEDTQKALKIAKDVHEIKKEYYLIMAGINDAIQGDIRNETMAVDEVLQLLKDTLLIDARSAGYELEVTIDCQKDIITDKHYYLMSIFNNLFVNAVEARTDDHVVLAVREHKEGNAYCFDVTDNGPGIKEGHLPDVFKPGFSTKINYETGKINRGLGLSLIREMIEEQFHGTISVVSAPGRTVFHMELPADDMRGV